MWSGNMLQIQMNQVHLFNFVEAGDSKTESWTWAQYLEECKAVAAPNKLFQEVCMSLIFRL